MNPRSSLPCFERVTYDERGVFFAALLDRCEPFRDTTCLTLTAIHPDGQHPTPSRHLPLNDPNALRDALERLDDANHRGWGAYFAVGLRRPGLTRWQRGGAAEVVALPALFIDVDDPSPEALHRIACADPSPSCIVSSGGGYHAYWWLDEPTTEFETARRALKALAVRLGGDRLSIAQSMRLPSSENTKPQRHHARCQVIGLTERRYALTDFAPLIPPHESRSTLTTQYVPNADRVAQIADTLLRNGGKPRGDWINGRCPFPERHKHDDQHPSFAFNMRSGYGYCHVCGTLLLKELCPALGI